MFLNDCLNKRIAIEKEMRLTVAAVMIILLHNNTIFPAGVVLFLLSSFYMSHLFVECFKNLSIFFILRNHNTTGLN